MVARFVAQLAGLFLIHSVLLKQDYIKTAALWRSYEAQTARNWVMLLAIPVYVAAAVLIYIGVKTVLATCKRKTRSVEARSELAIEVHREVLVEDHCNVTRAHFHFAASPSGDGGKFESESPLQSSDNAIVNGNLTEPGAGLS